MNMSKQTPLNTKDLLWRDPRQQHIYGIAPSGLPDGLIAVTGKLNLPCQYFMVAIVKRAQGQGTGCSLK